MSTHVGGKRLVDELLQRFRLLLFRDGAYDGFAHDVAAAIHHIGSGIGKDVRGELASLAVGSEIHVLIGRALLGQHILRLRDCRFVAVQREGVDTDECAALLCEFFVQRVQFGKLTHAGIAGGEPEIHHGDSVAGEQLVALHRISIQVFALKCGELLHAALTDLGEDAPEDYIVRGPNRITALPMEVPVCYQEIAHCLEKSIAKIETAILSALENTPPELYADIVSNGIYLAGGGALLRGLDKRLTDKINIPFHIAEDPLLSVAKGTGIALKNVDRFSFLMR